MSILLSNGLVYRDGKFRKENIFINDEGNLSFSNSSIEADQIIDATNLLISAGLIDTHVHLREPGFEYKETIATGSASAAKGGFNFICAMPNLNPVPDSVEHLKQQLDLIEKNSIIHVLPYGSITVGQKGRGQIADLEAMASYVRGYSDDGKGVQEQYNMLEAMERCAKLDRVIVAHCEDESELKPGGCIHEGKKAEELGVVGINSASEYKQVIRDLQLSEKTGCRYHVCHVSTKESVEAIAQAKAKGVKATGEVTVHHLLLNENDILCNDGKYKMNPPLRTIEDQNCLIEALKDGTLDCICTDHAPHSESEKSRGLEKSAMGIIGSEFAFSLVYTDLVKTNKVSLERVLDAFTTAPAKILQINAGTIQEGQKANLAIFDLNRSEIICKENIVSKGKSTPFEGKEVFGLCVYTISDGKIVYQRG